MTVAELTQDIQFTVDQHGKVTAVVLTPALWLRIVETMGSIEDRALIGSLRDRMAENASGALTVGDLRKSGLLGMWKDREDIEDSAEFVQQLRGAA